MRGIIYNNVFLYQAAMRAIYGRDFKIRYEAVASNIEKGWSVLDLCCGDCHIAKFLDKSVSYEGMDFNEVFLKRAKRNGIKASFRDLKKGPGIERKFDCVMMMGSLHQFSPEEDRILDVMKKAALKRIIVSEPCRNIVSSGNKYLAFLAKVVSNPGNDRISEIKRFTREDIMDIFRRHAVARVIDAGKDLIGIFDL